MSLYHKTPHAPAPALYPILGSLCQLLQTFFETQYLYNPFCVKACNSFCQTCTGNSSTQCLSCAAGYLLDNVTSCVAVCPTGEYSNGTNCLACDISCTSCTGASSSLCTVCSANYTNSSGQCVCKPGLYDNSGTCAVIMR